MSYLYQDTHWLRQSLYETHRALVRELLIARCECFFCQDYRKVELAGNVEEE